VIQSVNTSVAYSQTVRGTLNRSSSCINLVIIHAANNRQLKFDEAMFGRYFSSQSWRTWENNKQIKSHM